MNPIEERFVRAFIARDTQERWLQFLPSAKNRVKVTGRLAHDFLRDADARFVHPMGTLPPALQQALASWEKAASERQCHVIALADDLDGRSSSFAEAKAKADQSFGMVLVLQPDKLALYYGERDGATQPVYALFRP